MPRTCTSSSEGTATGPVQTAAAVVCHSPLGLSPVLAWLLPLWCSLHADQRWRACHIHFQVPVLVNMYSYYYGY